MAAGRKPTPAAMKELTGNPGRRPIPEGVFATEPVEWIEPPDVVTDRGYALGKWKELCHGLGAAGVLTTLDSSAFTQLCLAWADYLDACDEIEAEGLVVESKTAAGHTTMKANPAVAVRNAADAKYRQSLADFGLNPAARTKIDMASAPEEKDEFFDA